MIEVQRDGERWQVEPLGDAWRFWEEQFSGPWEPETKAVVEATVRGGTFVDVGAWVGPVTLWGSRLAREVVAIEPDPVAYRHLVTNTGANCRNVTLVHCAVGHPGRTLLRTNTGFGDSLSSTVRFGAETQEVESRTLADIIGERTDVQLIKMDIEGAEGDVIPRELDYLRELGAPILLSCHPQMWLSDPVVVMEQAGWTFEPVTALELLCRP